MILISSISWNCIVEEVAQKGVFNTWQNSSKIYELFKAEVDISVSVEFRKNIFDWIEFTANKLKKNSRNQYDHMEVDIKNCERSRKIES